MSEPEPESKKETVLDADSEAGADESNHGGVSAANVQDAVSSPRRTASEIHAAGLQLPRHGGVGQRVWLGEGFLMKSGVAQQNPKSKSAFRSSSMKGKLWRLWQLNYEMKALAYFASADELPVGYLDVQHMRIEALSKWEKENIASIQDKDYFPIKMVTTHCKREKPDKKKLKVADDKAVPLEKDANGDRWVFSAKDNQTVIILLNTELMRKSWLRRLESINGDVLESNGGVADSDTVVPESSTSVGYPNSEIKHAATRATKSDPSPSNVTGSQSPAARRLKSVGGGSKKDESSSAFRSPRRKMAARPSQWVVADYVSRKHHKNMDDGGRARSKRKKIRKVKSAQLDATSDDELENLLSQTAEPFLDPKSPEVEIQILSDVDDTFTCSGGGLLGSDQRFKRKAIYPGAAEMYLGLSLGPQPDRPKHPQGVVWMSARAADTPVIKLFGGRISDHHPISVALEEVGRNHGLDFGTGGGLYGKFLHNLHLKATTRNQEKQQQKYNNFIWYLSNGRESGAWTDEKSKKRLELSSPSPTRARRKSSVKRELNAAHRHQKEHGGKLGDEMHSGHGKGHHVKHGHHGHHKHGHHKHGHRKHGKHSKHDGKESQHHQQSPPVVVGGVQHHGDVDTSEALRREVLKAATARRLDDDLQRHQTDSTDDSDDVGPSGSNSSSPSSAAPSPRTAHIAPVPAWTKSSTPPIKTGNAQQFEGDDRSRQFYFLGDNGEGDEMLALRILQDYGQYMNACFIHNVTGMPPRGDLALALEEKGRLVYFETYLGAAVQAFRLGLLSGDSMLRVAQAIFESKFYIFCIILSNIRSLFAAQCQLSSDSADNTDLGDTILDASCILKIALALEMREPSRKNYRTKDVVAALQKEIGKTFWKWCESLTRDELEFDKIIPTLETRLAAEAARILAFRDRTVLEWKQAFYKSGNWFRNAMHTSHDAANDATAARPATPTYGQDKYLVETEVAAAKNEAELRELRDKVKEQERVIETLRARLRAAGLSDSIVEE